MTNDEILHQIARTIGFLRKLHNNCVDNQSWQMAHCIYSAMDKLDKAKLNEKEKKQ